jgi:CubicO group peptidase (beta-lactamase class C family)
MKRKCLFSGILILSVCLILIPWTKAYGAPINEIQDTISEYQNKSGVKNVSVVVYENGNVNYYGNTDAKSLFQIGSMTKSFTGLGILKLVNEGKTSLEDDISDLLDGFTAYYQGSMARITVGDLLRHTSGFTNSEREYPSANLEMSLMEWVDSVSGSDLKLEPGTSYSYANANYNLLGAIIERVSGKSYKEYMEAEILIPLQLEDICVGVPSEDVSICEGTRLGYGMAFDYAIDIHEGSIPAGYFYANSEDMCRYLLIQLGDAQIPKAYQELIDISHEYLLEDDTPGTYFAGWEYYGDGVVGHSGGTANYSSRMIFSKEKDIAVCVLANMNAAASTDRLCDDLYAILCNQETRGFVIDIWRIFDFIFTGISFTGIALLIIAVFFIKKRKLLLLCDITVFILFICQMTVIPLVFQSDWKNIAMVWAPWSVLGGLMIEVIDIMALSVMAVVRGKNEDYRKKNRKPAIDSNCRISGVG